MKQESQVSRAGPMLFHWPKLLYPFLSSTIFYFLLFLSIVDHSLPALHYQPILIIIIIIITTYVYQ